MPNYCMFPFDKVPKGSKIVIYGAGNVGQQFISQVITLSYCDILYVVDRNYEEINSVSSIPVLSPKELQKGNYDYIVISVTSKFHNSMKSDLNELGISPEKCIFSEYLIDDKTEVFGSRYFSYHGEDVCAMYTFKSLGISKPSYIDIGAYHPYDASNTALMYMSGGKGINIEANPDLVKPFYRERPGDTNLNIGIAPTSGTLPFYVFDEYPGRSTFSKKELESFQREYPNVTLSKTIEVPVVELDEVVRQYSNGVYPDFISIDVEGMDFDVLKSCNFSDQTPYIICVEVGKQDGSLANMTSMLKDKGYEFYILLADTALYIKKGLKERMKPIP